MSSTHRGAVRHTDDWYRTPSWVTRAIIPYLDTNGVVLDPCCGDGAILDCFPTMTCLTSSTVGIELDSERAAGALDQGHFVTCGDGLTGLWPSAHLIITNPPFSLAEKFLRRALSYAIQDGSTVAFLLRLAFLESAKRKPLHRDFPADVFPLAERPSFTEDGKTDSCAYAWFVWDMHPAAVKDRLECGGRLWVLTDEAPKRQRRCVGHVDCQARAVLRMRPIQNVPGYHVDEAPKRERSKTLVGNQVSKAEEVST